MTFTEKISGTRVDDFEITPIFNNQVVSLVEVMARVKKQETMNYLLDTLRFYKGGSIGDWFTTIDWDTIFKLSILENYPNYEKELTEHFGANWLNHYIRFSHQGLTNSTPSSII